MAANRRFRPLTPDRWKYSEKLLGSRGACGGCWCMFWMLPSPEHEASVYEGNRRARTAIVASGRVAGLIFCGRGITVALLRAAILHEKKHRGKMLEGYPIDPKAGRLPAATAYVGLADAFRKAGFEEVARRAGTRPIFRYEIGG